MFRGIYTATSGMVASSRKQEMLTHNLSNAQTPGYKQDQTVLRAFPDILMHRIRDEQGLNVEGKMSFQGSTPLGVLHTGVYAQEGIPLFNQGDLRETGRALDVALADLYIYNPDTEQKGYVFFAVQAGQGETRYTRNGQFTLDAEGNLTTSEGYYVLDSQGETIQFTGDFQITEDGRIFELTDGLVEARGRLGLAYTEEPQQLVKEGNSLYRMEGAGLQDITALDFINPAMFQVKQGFLEGSNVDVTTTMTEMLSSYRLYEANQKILQTYDRNLEKAVNEIGRVY